MGSIRSEQIASQMATKLRHPALGNLLARLLWDQREVAALVLAMLDRDSRCKARQRCWRGLTMCFQVACTGLVGWDAVEMVRSEGRCCVRWFVRVSRLYGCGLRGGSDGQRMAGAAQSGGAGGRRLEANWQ